MGGWWTGLLQEMTGLNNNTNNNSLSWQYFISRLLLLTLCIQASTTLQQTSEGLFHRAYVGVCVWVRRTPTPHIFFIQYLYILEAEPFLYISD